MLKRLSRGEEVIVVDHGGHDERTRSALRAVALWAAEGMGQDAAEQLRTLTLLRARIDGGIPAERLLTEIGTDLERAGKPALAGFVEIVFAKALDDANRPAAARSAVVRPSARAI